MATRVFHFNFHLYFSIYIYIFLQSPPRDVVFIFISFCRRNLYKPLLFSYLALHFPFAFLYLVATTYLNHHYCTTLKHLVVATKLYRHEMHHFCLLSIHFVSCIISLSSVHIVAATFLNHHYYLSVDHIVVLNKWYRHNLSYSC